MSELGDEGEWVPWPEEDLDVWGGREASPGARRGRAARWDLVRALVLPCPPASMLRDWLPV